MMLSPLLWLLACVSSCGPDAPTGALPDGSFPKVAMDVPGASPVAQLHLDPMLGQGVFALTDTNLPAGALAAPETLTRELAPFRKPRGPVVMPFPFAIDGDARRSLPQDLTVRVDGVELPNGGLGGGRNTWRVRGNDLQIHSNGAVAEITYRAAGELVARRSLSASGLSPADFVRTSLTFDMAPRNPGSQNQTRAGVSLTSPSTATWTVQVPAQGGTFETFLALDPPALTLGASDGAVASILVDGVEVHREELGPLADPPAFLPVRLDLGAYAGKTVALGLRTEVTGTPDHDVVFFGSPTMWGPPPGQVRRVIVIGLDTTRPDHISWYGTPRPTTPELDAIANQSAVMTSAWTPAPRTRPSFRSATTGRYPLLAVGATNLGDVFRQNGFATAGIVANIHLQPRFDFDDGFEWWWYDGNRPADVQVDRALAWLTENQARDSYLFLHIMDPHLPYTPPGAFATKFVEDPDLGLPRNFNRGQVKGWTRKGAITEQRAAHITGLYDGELGFTSQELGRFFAAVDAMPGQTLVVVHSDHGEELWDHGDFEHNHTLYDEVDRAVLWLRPPGGTLGGPVRVEHPATLADIGPTLYDFLGFQNLPPTDGISLRPWMEGTREPGSRPIGLGHIQYAMEQWGVTLDGHKYLVTTGTGAEELYDLTADPGEQTNLIGSKDPAPWRTALPVAHPELIAGPGWRVRIALEPGDALTVDLPARAVQAGVYDPESLTNNRANEAWGEVPAVLPSDVGELTLAEDGRSFTFTAGEHANGLLWVLTESPLDAEGVTVGLNGAGLTGRALADGRYELKAATGGGVTVEPGFVVVPPPGELERMQAADQPVQNTDDDETCRLCVLGYKQGPECEACLAETPDPNP